MPGRLILSLSALVFALTGIAAMFAPDELGRLLSGAPLPALSLSIQLAGSGLIGVAFINWMSRGNRIGGIYGRPVAIGNLVLTTSAGFALGKAASEAHQGVVIAALAVVFGALALTFAWLAFVHDPLS